MNKRRLALVSFLSATLLACALPKVGVSAADLESDVSIVAASVPQSITYKREYHRVTGFTPTKFYRTKKNGQSYAGYLTFVQLSGKNYAIYEGRLYLEGSNGGNRPIPMKFEPLELE